MKLKVCGLKHEQNIKELMRLPIDCMGFIFYKKSPRFVAEQLSFDFVRTIPKQIKKVGVFVNENNYDIFNHIAHYDLDMVQLHGNESPELCEELSEDTEVIKVFSIGKETGSIDKLIAPYDNVCDYYLFDTSVKGKKGGTGEKFDWKKLTDAKIEKPFFLSGGIGPEDAALVKKFKHPDFFGIDVNSKFEKEPGVKDMALVLGFVKDMK